MPERNYWTRMRGGGVSRRDVLRGAAFGGAGLAGAALIGCGGSDSTPASSSANKPTAPGSAPVTAAVKPGGRLNLTQAGEPPSFDLHLESTTYTNFATSPSYNQLIKMD